MPHKNEAGLNADNGREFLDRRRRLHQGLLLLRSELDLDDLLRAALPELHRDPEKLVPDAIFPLKKDRTGQDGLFVLENRFDHLRRRRPRGIPGARAHQLRNLRPTVRGPGADFIELGLAQPPHGHQLRQRDAGHGRIARERDHRVAVPAQDEGVDVLDGNVELHGNEGPHPGRVQDPGHTHDALPRKAAQPVDRLAHGVERVGHGDDHAVGRVLHDLLGDRLHDFVIDLQEVVPAHARLAGHARRDDHDVGVLGGRIVAGAEEARVGAVNRTGLVDVERNTLRFLGRDVDDHDVGQLLDGDGPGNRGANIPGAAYDGDFSVHGSSASIGRLASSVPVRHRLPHFDIVAGPVPAYAIRNRPRRQLASSARRVTRFLTSARRRGQSRLTPSGTGPVDSLLRTTTRHYPSTNSVSTQHLSTPAPTASAPSTPAPASVSAPAPQHHPASAPSTSAPLRQRPYMFSIMTSANWDVFSSVAPSMRRARSYVTRFEAIARSRERMTRSAASVQPMKRSIISPERMTEPGLTLSRFAYFGAVPWVASNTAWPVT